MKPGGHDHNDKPSKPGTPSEPSKEVQQAAHASPDAFKALVAKDALSSKLSEIVPIEDERVMAPPPAEVKAVSLANYHEVGGLTRESILLALQEVSDRLGAKGTPGKILLLGGAAMIMKFQNRPGTKDIDAITEPKTVIREVSNEMAEEYGLPDGWLNDAAKGFMPDSSKCSYSAEGMPVFPNLKVLAPSAGMLFAMKALATRIENSPDGEMSRDLKDLRSLAKELGVKNQDDAERIIRAFYPPERIPQRFWYALEEILEEGGAE